MLCYERDWPRLFQAGLIQVFRPWNDIDTAVAEKMTVKKDPASTAGYHAVAGMLAGR